MLIVVQAILVDLPYTNLWGEYLVKYHEITGYLLMKWDLHTFTPTSSKVYSR